MSYGINFIANTTTFQLISLHQKTLLLFRYRIPKWASGNQPNVRVESFGRSTFDHQMFQNRLNDKLTFLMGFSKHYALLISASPFMLALFICWIQGSVWSGCSWGWFQWKRISAKHFVNSFSYLTPAILSTTEISPIGFWNSKTICNKQYRYF